MRLKCTTPYCRNRRARCRTKCHKCRKRIWRARNPLKAAYCTLRDHAKARQIKFSITFEQFARFAKQTLYIKETGLGRMCLTVDRKNNLRGYEPDNIQVLTRAENCVKRCKQDQMRMRHGMKWAY